MSAAKIEAMCIDCRHGYVWVNPGLHDPRCFCGGRLTGIEPIPNELPYSNGRYVLQYKVLSPTRPDKEE